MNVQPDLPVVFIDLHFCNGLCQSISVYEFVAKVHIFCSFSSGNVYWYPIENIYGTL